MNDIERLLSYAEDSERSAASFRKEAQKLCKHENVTTTRSRINDEYDAFGYYETRYVCNTCGLRWHDEATVG